ncbi:MAG: hypothetical protein CL932_18205 [Deltaproteobacteria bacterium]|nr:hypothetical protein [Deltaproteobacteria bacterium]
MGMNLTLKIDILVMVKKSYVCKMMSREGRFFVEQLTINGNLKPISEPPLCVSNFDLSPLPIHKDRMSTLCDMLIRRCRS